MLTKFQLLQSATAVGIAIGAFMAPVTNVQANPSISTNEQQITSAPQPVVDSVTNPHRYGHNGIGIALGSKIETVSGAAETALAEHLAASGVKFYGAYWCSHCQKQKSLFGDTAAAKLPYIECAADGENSQRQLCKDKNVQMFPTWAINGKFLTGTRDLKEIATLTGYKGSMNFKYHK
jgi:glutaredoxin